MYCIFCGKQIEEDSKFCIHCGSSQAKTEAPIYCSFCGSKLEKDAKFCTGCGSKVITQAGIASEEKAVEAKEEITEKTIEEPVKGVPNNTKPKNLDKVVDEEQKVTPETKKVAKSTTSGPLKVINIVEYIILVPLGIVVFLVGIAIDFWLAVGCFISLIFIPVKTTIIRKKDITSGKKVIKSILTIPSAALILFVFAILSVIF